MDRERFRVNYERRPAQPNVRPESTLPAAEPEKPKRRKGSKKSRRRIIIVALALLILIAGGTAYYILSRPKDPIPANIRADALFTLYYPTTYPKGYSLDKTSFQYVNQVVTFTLTSASAKIFFSEQAVPQGFDFDNFNQQLLANPKGILTPYGKGVTGTAQDSKVGSLVINKTWVLLSSNPKTPDQTLENLLDHLKQSRD